MLVERIHSFNPISESGVTLHGNPGRFELSTETDSEGSSMLKFENPYYDVGGRTYAASGSTYIPANATGIVALQIPMTGPSPDGAEIIYCGGMAALQVVQKDYSNYVIPLYQLDEGSVVCDFRLGPPAIAWEFAS